MSLFATCLPSAAFFSIVNPISQFSKTTCVMFVYLQDALLFLQAFFTDLASDPHEISEHTYNVANQNSPQAQAPPSKSAQAPPSDEPVMSLKDLEAKEKLDEGRAIFDEINEEHDDGTQAKEQSNQSTFYIKYEYHCILCSPLIAE